MPPIPTMTNSVYCCNVYAITFCQGNAFFFRFQNFKNLLFVQYCLWAIRTTFYQFGVLSKRMLVTIEMGRRTMTPFRHAIMYVNFLSSHKQMFRVTATRIITFMQNIKSRGNNSNPSLICKTMAFNINTSFTNYLSVMFVRRWSFPIPASNRMLYNMAFIITNSGAVS